MTEIYLVVVGALALWRVLSSLTSPTSCGARGVWNTGEVLAGGRGKSVFGENRKQLIWIGGKGAICSVVWHFLSYVREAHVGHNLKRKFVC